MAHVVAYRLAEDNLRLGRTVVADCVDPLPTMRCAWKAVADRAGVGLVDVELVCSDALEHRRRVGSRSADIARLTLPTRSDVQAPVRGTTAGISGSRKKWTRLPR